MIEALDGMQILTIAVNLPGPVAAARLRAMGAVVYKVELPAGDPLAAVSPAWYAELCEGQQVLRLDLKNWDERVQFDELLSKSDLLITSSRLASLERLGLDWETVHSKVPSLCQVAIIGYPRPEENKPGHDLTYQAAVGLVNPPPMPSTLISDLAGAERAVTAALGLLLERERYGRSGYAEISLAEAAESFAKPVHYGLTVPAGVLGGGEPNYNLYATLDGWIAIAPLEAHFWRRMIELLGLQHERVEISDLTRVFSTRSTKDWIIWGEENDLPVASVRGF